MINKVKTKEIGLALLVFLWLFPLIENYGNGYEKKDLIFNIMFLCGVISVSALKNNALAITVLFLTVVIASIYDFSYLFIFLPAEMLNVSYRYFLDYIKDKNKRKKSKELYNTFLTMSIASFVFQFFYFLFSVGQSNSFGWFSAVFKDISWILVFIAIIFIACLKKRNTDNKKDYNKLCIIYAFAVIGVIETAFIVFFSGGYVLSRLHRSYFLCWFVFIVLSVCFDDPIVSGIVKKLNNVTLLMKSK